MFFLFLPENGTIECFSKEMKTEAGGHARLATVNPDQIDYVRTPAICTVRLLQLARMHGDQHQHGPSLSR